MSSYNTVILQKPSNCDLLWICSYCNKRVPMRVHEFPIHCRCGNVGVLEESIPYDIDKDPTLLGMAGNLLKATLKAARIKFRRVVKEEYDRRIKICSKPCEFVIMRKVIDKEGKIIDSIPYRCRHKKCGCFLKTKAWLESEKCPMGYWNE